MTDLTKIEKPYLFCTKEEKEGLAALIGVEGALQRLSRIGNWELRSDLDDNLGALFPTNVYRQNPAWQPPTLDVPDWFWENTDFNCVAMNPNGTVHAYRYKPCDERDGWSSFKQCLRLDNFFTHHDFNPRSIPWNKSLTVRPGLEK